MYFNDELINVRYMAQRGHLCWANMSIVVLIIGEDVNYDVENCQKRLIFKTVSSMTLPFNFSF